MNVKRLLETALGFRVFHFFRRRVVIVSLAIIVQLAVLVVGIARFSQHYVEFYSVGTLISLATALYIINNRSNPAFKIAWLVPILLMPYFGGLIYILFGGSRFTRRSKRQIEHDEERLRNAFAREYGEMDKRNPETDASVSGQARCLTEMSGYPAFIHSDTEFFPTAEQMWQRMLLELNRAERFIFMEYFIIEKGEMWDSILSVLEKKAAQGVEVRLIYDDIGCITRLPFDYVRTLRKKGIQAYAFNPYMPVLTSGVNNRDHRKICVIDGCTAFTGGTNLADEYVNRVQRFGHWKDSALLIRGEAVWGFTVMSLDMWDAMHNRREDWNAYRGAPEKLEAIRGEGVVLPFCTTLFSPESVSETAMLGIINHATRYVYITTPYLIPTHELMLALCTAARSGVDVRIVTPYVPDKKAVFAATRAHYMQLTQAGVKIYEYTPGFIHAKQIVADDHYAIVGSMNLDYRSLYLNFECAAWMVDTACIPSIRDDVLSVVKKSEPITIETCVRLEGNVAQRLWRSILRGFAPLM